MQKNIYWNHLSKVDIFLNSNLPTGLRIIKEKQHGSQFYLLLIKEKKMWKWKQNGWINVRYLLISSKISSKLTTKTNLKMISDFFFLTVMSVLHLLGFLCLFFIWKDAFCGFSCCKVFSTSWTKASHHVSVLINKCITLPVMTQAYFYTLIHSWHGDTGLNGASHLFII